MSPRCPGGTWAVHDDRDPGSPSHAPPGLERSVGIEALRVATVHEDIKPVESAEPGFHTALRRAWRWTAMCQLTVIGSPSRDRRSPTDARCGRPSRRHVSPSARRFQSPGLPAATRSVRCIPAPRRANAVPRQGWSSLPPRLAASCPRRFTAGNQSLTSARSPEATTGNGHFLEATTSHGPWIDVGDWTDGRRAPEVPIFP